MSKYIDSEKLIVELNRRILQEQGFEDGDAECGYKCALKDIKRFIVSIEQEQPEVDLEKELEQYRDINGDYYGHLPDGRYAGDYFDFENIEEFALHFYELGLNARKK